MLLNSLAEVEVAKALRNLREYNKKLEKAKRVKIIDYYENMQLEYLKGYGFQSDAGKWTIPPAFYNITEKVINKISLVYKYVPDRKLDDVEVKEGEQDQYQQWISENPRYNLALKSAERYKNCLHRILFRPTYDTNTKQWIPFIETEYQAHFLDGDPLNPVAYSIPIKQDVENKNPEDERWLFWSKELYFEHDANGKVFKDEYDGKNPFGIIPLVEMRKQMAVNQYECAGAIDLVQANESINVAMMNLNMMIHFQAFDQAWDNAGLDEKEWKNIKSGPNKVWHFPQDTTVSLLGYNPKITECVEAVRASFQMVSEMYNVKIQWSIDGTPASGFSLLVQNIDLIEAREDDIDVSKVHEKELYDVLSNMQKFYVGQGQIDSKEPKLPLDAKVIVDFQPFNLPINQSEEMDRWEFDFKHNAKSEIDYIQSQNPDMDEVEAEEKYNKNKTLNGRLSTLDKMRAAIEEPTEPVIEIEE